MYYFLGTARDGYYYYALNAANGSLRWHFKVGTAHLELTGQLLMHGSVYLSEASITDGYSMVIALDASTGKIQWQHRYNGTGIALGQKHSSDYATGLQLQAGTDQTLYSSSSTIKNGVATLMLSALSAKDGTSIWQNSAKTNEQVVGAQVVNCVLYLSTAYNDASHHLQSRMYAYDAATGARKWTRQLVGAPNSSFSIDNGVIYLGNIQQSESGNVVALRANDGSQVWQYTPQGRMSAPTVSNGMVYIVTSDGSEANQELIALNASSGKVQWVKHLPHHVVPEIAPVVSGNTLYLSTPGNSVDMFLTSDGNIAGSFVVGGKVSSVDWYNQYVQLTITQ